MILDYLVGPVSSQVPYKREAGWSESVAGDVTMEADVRVT